MTSCAGRTLVATPDRDRLAPCIDAQPMVPAIAELPRLEPFTLPDGREVVLLAVVKKRDAAQVRYAIEERGARILCQSTTLYVRDWIDGMAED